MAPLIASIASVADGVKLSKPRSNPSLLVLQ